MRSRRLRSITDVAERHLCTGCGACAFAQPDAITMVDDLDAGRRPMVASSAGRELPTLPALAACPGVGLSHSSTHFDGGIPSLRDKWGTVLEVWEGFAVDHDVRHGGSSGGVASALAIHCLESEGMHGLLHIRGRKDLPYLNETVMSTSREAIVAATGSRYAPASPCDRLDLITDAPAPSVFIGKPCDVGATSKLRSFRPDLDEKLGLTIAIFCAGTPTTRGTFEVLREMNVQPDQLASLRYRGNGWPGDAVATIREADGTVRDEHLTYEESWGRILQKHRQWRCYVCADHTGEFADIAVGDPWYRPIGPDEPGRNLILARTERGRRILHAAIDRGIIDAVQVSADRVSASQPGLVRIRGSVGGRIATLRMLGLPTPAFENMPMLATWWRELSPREKIRSTLGTIKRVIRKRLYRRSPVRPLDLNDDDTSDNAR